MSKQQGITLFASICMLIGTLIVIQLWLVAASLDALYSNQTDALFPAATASTVLFLINFGLLRFVLSFDRKLGGETNPGQP
jgi:hypothetical protein